MKKRIFLSMVMLATSIVFTTTPYAETFYYVQSIKAKVMSSSSFKSKVMAEVGKGSRLVSTGREGNWVKVKFEGKEGYVSSLLLATHPPFVKTAVIKGDETEIKQGVRRRASSYTSAAAARGLAQDDRRRLSKEERIDYESLEKVESFKLSPEEISRFMEGSK